MNRIFVTLVLLACSTILVAAPLPTAQASSPQAPTQHQQTDPAPSPQQLLQTGVESLIALMSQEPAPSSMAVAHFLDQRVAPLFDFDTMARAASGRYYQSLSPRQRTAMADEIKQMFLTRLALGLTYYKGQKVRFLRPRFSPEGDEAMISMAILNPGRYPARIDFRLAPEGNNWRIIDLAANGTSAVVYYRKMLVDEMMRRNYQQRARGTRPYAGPMRSWQPTGR